ncbi:hypothetical protein HJC23_003710 [Cyclotella cryptica]|uniref:P-type ATPase A domain-containing protein n=1 Tax=Cyclotella cryptica TaxID=29204 RepID=A0ABD3QUK8_9STRA
MNALAKDGCCSGNGDGSSLCCEKNAMEESPSSNEPSCSNDSCCNNNVKQCCTDSSEPHASESCKDNVRCCNGTSTTGVPSCCKSNDENNSPVSNCCESRTSSPKIIPVARESCCNVNKNCCSSSNQQQQDEPKQHLTCLAVIRPDNTTVVVFDVKGRSRAFRSNNAYYNKQLQANKLCFSSHGAGENVDGMLTHCFDSNGEHGVPEESCTCGNEEPHLHAHVHNPEVCDDDDSNSASSAATQKRSNQRTNWRYLSQITLTLDDTDQDPLGNGMFHVPINPSMPKQCNASVGLQQHLQDRGLKIVQRECCVEKDGEGNGAQQDCEKHRKYKVQHVDHTDYLVHNEVTGDLHMEHPCTSCGENDIHGRFDLLHTRSWLDEANVSYVPRGMKKKKSREIRVHFFQEPNQEPFHLLEVFSRLFELESSRVHAVRVVDDLMVAERRPSSASAVGEVSSHRGRSQFFVEKICCASETAQIKSLLKVAGVYQVSVNTTTKMVYVDHDTNAISAADIANILNEQRFGAHVKRDFALEIATPSAIPTDIIVLSKFGISNDLRLTDAVTREKLLDEIQQYLKERFSRKDEVKNITWDSSRQTLVVEHNPYFVIAVNIANALKSSGFDKVIIELDGGADGLWALASMESNKEDFIEHHRSTVRVTVVLSGVFWIVSMLSLIGGNWDYLKYVGVVSVALGLPPIAMKAYKTLLRCHFDVNCMMLFAVLGALALQEFTEAAAVTFLFAISEALESKATSRARNALSAIICLRPEHANVINPVTKDIVVIPATAVAVGSLVRVRTGDKVPCDGVVVEGKSTIDESTLTGESRPVSKSEGMCVSGGTINLTGQLLLKTTATSDNSAVSRLIRLVEEAQINRSETEKMVDKFARVYTPFVVLAALCMATIPWAFGREVGQYWAKNALVTIVIACPCALVISTPVVYVAGLTAAAQRGVLVKGGQHLESLGRVKAISFDKTGTLSEGVFQLLHFREIGQRSRKEVLSLLAMMEAPASHPLSDAIVKGAANEQAAIPTNLELTNHTLLAGEGITAMIGDKRVYVGNKKLFRRVGLYDALPSEISVLVDGWAQAGGTTGFISMEGEGIIGAYCVADKIRGEAKSVINSLKKMGIDITMLTGDLRPSAIAIGNEIGLDEEHIKSELLPEDKLNEIRNKVSRQKEAERCWKSKQSVMMVGDGVNDGPALALADVSVAMGGGSSLAMETADITLMDSNLEKLFYIVRTGRRVIRTIIENIVISLFLKALVVSLMFAGWGSLWAAIASDVGAMLIVTLNGMKLLPSTRSENGLIAKETRNTPDAEV